MWEKFYIENLIELPEHFKFFMYFLLKETIKTTKPGFY